MVMVWCHAPCLLLDVLPLTTGFTRRLHVLLCVPGADNGWIGWRGQARQDAGSQNRCKLTRVLPLITCSWTRACLADISALCWGIYGRCLSLLSRVWQYTIADLNLLVVCWWSNVCDWLNLSNSGLVDRFASMWHVSESVCCCIQMG